MFESIYNEIINNILLLSNNSSYELKSLVLDSKKSFIINVSGKVGVGFECKFDKPFHEKFSSIELQYIEHLNLGNKETSVLFLFMNRNDLCKNVESPLLKEFSNFCTRFVILGEKASNRKYIETETLDWWKGICSLIGNSNKSLSTYALLGELVTYLYLKKKQPSVEYIWTGSEKKRLDFIGNKTSYEVKSSVIREDTSVTMHGIFQADQNNIKDSYLVFCRFEPTSVENGLSINNIMDKLNIVGCNCNEIENHLAKMCFYKGASSRDQKYSLLEMRIYKIDGKFPKITSGSFIGGAIPNGILDIDYRVSLNNLQFTQVKLDFI